MSTASRASVSERRAAGHELIDETPQLLLECPVVAEAGQRIGLGSLADRLVAVRVAQGDRGLCGEQLDHLEVALGEVHLRGADAGDVEGAQHLAVHDERHDHHGLRFVRSAGDLEGSRVAQRVVGQDRLSMLDGPAHEAPAERDHVAADLLGMELACQDGDHGALRVVGAVDGQVVVGDHLPESVGDRLEHVRLLEAAEQASVGFEQVALRL